MRETSTLGPIVAILSFTIAILIVNLLAITSLEFQSEIRVDERKRATLDSEQQFLVVHVASFLFHTLLEFVRLLGLCEHGDQRFKCEFPILKL